MDKPTSKVEKQYFRKSRAALKRSSPKWALGRGSGQPQVCMALQALLGDAFARGGATVVYISGAVRNRQPTSGIEKSGVERTWYYRGREGKLLQNGRAARLEMLDDFVHTWMNEHRPAWDERVLRCIGSENLPPLARRMKNE